MHYNSEHVAACIECEWLRIAKLENLSAVNHLTTLTDNSSGRCPSLRFSTSFRSKKTKVPSIDTGGEAMADGGRSSSEPFRISTQHTSKQVMLPQQSWVNATSQIHGITVKRQWNLQTYYDRMVLYKFDYYYYHVCSRKHALSYAIWIFRFYEIPPWLYFLFIVLCIIHVRKQCCCITRLKYETCS